MHSNNTERRVETVIDLWIRDFTKNPDAISSFVAGYIFEVQTYAAMTTEDILALDIRTLDIPDIKAVMLHRDYKDSRRLQGFVRRFYRYICTGRF